MEKASPRARLFVALDLPDDARAEIVRWREGALAGVRAVRPVAPEALHVTLVFLGHLPEPDIPRIRELMARAVETRLAPRLHATRVRLVPPRRARLIALDLADEGGRAGAVQLALAGAFSAATVYEPEARPFWPHVTLARVGRGERVEFAGGSVADPPTRPWPATAVTLYRSRLSRAGASYEAIARLPFPSRA